MPIPWLLFDTLELIFPPFIVIFLDNIPEKAISMAQSYKEFENIMHKMGYEITNRYGKLSIKREPYKKNIRIERAFGEDYSIDRINTRIELTKSKDTNITRNNPNNTIYYRKEFEKVREEKKHGIYGLYKYYCYILKIYPVFLAK